MWVGENAVGLLGIDLVLRISKHCQGVLDRARSPLDGARPHCVTIIDRLQNAGDTDKFERHD